jgi:hypothetical protein
MRVKSAEFIEACERAQAHRRRCRSLPPLQPGEHERLVAAFLAAGSITQCPVRYAAPVEQRLDAADGAAPMGPEWAPNGPPAQQVLHSPDGPH